MDLRTRHPGPEQMDGPGISLSSFAAALGGIRRVNRWLGGTRALQCALAPHVDALLKARPGLPVRILDVGCGAADIPAALLAWGQRTGRPLSVAALDLHPHALACAREDAGKAGVRLLRADALRLPFCRHAFDIITASMFLHHLPQAAAEHLLARLAREARHAVIVNDLYRGAVPYIFIRVVGPLLSRDPMFLHDGPLSVARGFRPDDFAGFLLRQEGRFRVRRVWPYRVIIEGSGGGDAS